MRRYSNGQNRRMGAMGDLTDLGTLDTSSLLGDPSSFDLGLDPALGVSGVGLPSSTSAPVDGTAGGGPTPDQIAQWAQLGVQLTQETVNLIRSALPGTLAALPPGYTINQQGQIVPLPAAGLGGLGVYGSLLLFGLGGYALYKILED